MISAYRLPLTFLHLLCFIGLKIIHVDEFFFFPLSCSSEGFLFVEKFEFFLNYFHPLEKQRFKGLPPRVWRVFLVI